MTERQSGIDRRSLLAGGALATAAAGLVTAVEAGPGAAPPLPAARTPQIFATGGGWFAPPWETSVFPQYLLGLTAKKHTKICWLGPASGENPAGFEAFSRGMEAYDCEVRHFNIYQPATLDFTSYLMDMDIVFVGGGSTKNMMALWREWEFDRALRTAWQAGVVMSGGSAGLICWFESGLTDSFPAVLNGVKATGFLKGSTNPHYNIRPDRKTRYRELIADGRIDSPGLALDQDVGVLYRGQQRVELVSSSRKAGAWLLTRTANGGIDEKPLPVRYLGI